MTPDDFRIVCTIVGGAFLLILVLRRWRRPS
jgi:hypothetical protein